MSELKIEEDKNGTCSILWLKNLNTFKWDAGYDARLMNSPALIAQLFSSDLEDFRKELVECCTEWDDAENASVSFKPGGSLEGHNKSVHRVALIMCATSHLQEKAEEFLHMIGFDSAGPYEKLKHAGSKLTIWWMHAPAFMEAIGYEGYPKRMERLKAA